MIVPIKALFLCTGPVGLHPYGIYAVSLESGRSKESAQAYTPIIEVIISE